MILHQLVNLIPIDRKLFLFETEWLGEFNHLCWPVLPKTCGINLGESLDKTSCWDRFMINLFFKLS